MVILMISKYIPLSYPLGLDWDSISECVQWMVPFVNVAKKVPVKLKNFKKVAAEDRHNIQTHTNYLDMLVSGLWMCSLGSWVHYTSLVLRQLSGQSTSLLAPGLAHLSEWVPNHQSCYKQHVIYPNVARPWANTCTTSIGEEFIRE